MWSGLRSETTDVEVVWPHGANGGGVYVNEIERGNVRGQPPVKWRDRVQEYVRERGEGSLRNLDQARGNVKIEMKALLPWPSPGGSS